MSTVVLLGGIPSHKDLAPSVIFIILVSGCSAARAQRRRVLTRRLPPSPSSVRPRDPALRLAPAAASLALDRPHPAGHLHRRAPGRFCRARCHVQGQRQRGPVQCVPSAPPSPVHAPSSLTRRPSSSLARSRRAHPSHRRLRLPHRPAHQRLGLARLPRHGRRRRRRGGRRWARVQAVVAPDDRAHPPPRHVCHHRHGHRDRHQVERRHRRHDGRRRADGQDAAQGQLHRLDR